MSSSAKRRFSYTDQKIRRGKALRAAGWILAAFLCYELVTGLFMTPRVCGSDSMEPGLRPGDRVLISPIVFGARTPFSAKKLPGILKPKRGDLVLVSPPYAVPPRGLSGFFGPLLRFFSFQTIAARDSAVIKRVVGLPGDVLTMKDSVVSVDSGGASRSLTEFELAALPYEIRKAERPEGWDDSMPFADSGMEIRLAEGQYYFLSDDRGATNDSRSWGSLPDDRILGKVLLRYWPLFRK